MFRASDSTESDVRYAAYAARVKTILRSAHRYVAYTSDIGESFRPIAHPWLIKGAYGVSWAYLIGDVANEGRKAYVSNQAILNPDGALPTTADADIPAPSTLAKAESLAKEAATSSLQAAKHLGSATPGAIAPLDDYRTVMAQRALFQSIASMGLPAFTIHSIVKYSGRYLKKASNKTIRTYGPIGLGLAAVPFLPFMFDAPVEKAIEWSFHHGFEAMGMASPAHTAEQTITPAGESKKEL